MLLLGEIHCDGGGEARAAKPGRQTRARQTRVHLSSRAARVPAAATAFGACASRELTEISFCDHLRCLCVGLVRQRRVGSARRGWQVGRRARSWTAAPRRSAARSQPERSDASLLAQRRERGFRRAGPGRDVGCGVCEERLQPLSHLRYSNLSAARRTSSWLLRESFTARVGALETVGSSTWQPRRPRPRLGCRSCASHCSACACASAARHAPSRSQSSR